MNGLELFKERMAPFAAQFVLIGGTAAALTMEQEGLSFRATKDLDIVLIIEAVDARFGETFWRFVQEGGYQIREASDSGRPVLYRFSKPADDRFPFMLELFCRVPDGLQLAEGSHLTPIPLSDGLYSLSAILLDDDYYTFVRSGRREGNGLAWIGEDRLIPLKAAAWLDLRTRQARGEQIDSRNVRKHLHDVMRLSQLLSPATRMVLPSRIRSDMIRFQDACATEESVNLKSLNVAGTVDGILRRIAMAFQLDTPLDPLP